MVGDEGYLRIDDDWSGVMSVIDGAEVDVDANSFTLNLSANGSAVADGTYSVADLNTEIGSTIFSGTGTIVVTADPITPPGDESAITAWNFDPSGTSSLTFTGAVSSVYIVKSAAALTDTFNNLTPTAVTSGGTLSGDQITITANPVTVEFSVTEDVQFFKIVTP